MQRGFTLIEILIVVAIIVIIAGIAISSFSGAGADSRRARAMADLAGLNDAVARHYQTAMTYDTADLPTLINTAGLSLTTEYVFELNVPRNADVADDGQSYSVTATPAAGGAQQGNGAMYIDDTGRRCFYPGDDKPDFTTCPSAF